MATESSFTCRCREPKKASRTHLPTEIIFEILLRLPVKSLLRFRCVSKSWRSLISQPKFAKTHVSLASVNTDYTHHRLILQGLWGDSDFKSCSLFSISNENSFVAVDIDCPLKGGHYIPYMKEVVGSCDGLVCIARGLEVFIWNPSTRKSKRLPELHPSTRKSPFISYGFGYDESTHDYKVAAFCVHDVVTGGYEVEMKVYTLRTDVWRRIGWFLHWLPSDGPGTYLNGALHWTSERIDDTPSIVCLDLAKETHGEVLEPVYRDGPLYRRLLAVLNGCLRILCAHSDCADVWVMKEYGTRESWTKLVVIPKHQLGGPYSTIPLCILKNGELLLRNYSHLARYNPEDGTFIWPTPTIRSCLEHSNVYPYVESLVSPDIDADRGVQWQHLY